MILPVLISISLVHIMVPAGYYFWMKRLSKKGNWNLALSDFEPKVTLIVATYNEANIIEDKLNNIRELIYPKDNLEVIVVDSASTDGTAQVVKDYLERNSLPFKTIVIEEDQRRGKSKALNNALQTASGNIVATSDADCIWTPQSFNNALKYLSDKSVAAVCGVEVLTNPEESSAARTELQHRQVFNFIRVGESKLQSTIVFEGALALYKKGLLEKFDEDCDDSGSALNLVQKGFRTIMVPDASFLNASPGGWKIKATKKIRRAQHLVDVWWKCLKLSLRRKSKMNLWISTGNIFLYLFNPFLFPVFMATIVWVFLAWPLTSLTIPVFLLVPKLRDAIMTYLSNYMFLLYAILMQALGRKQIIWKK